MSGHKARVRTIQALLAGSPCIAASLSFTAIQGEFQEVYAVRKIRQDARRRLLEVLHSARALDTTLKTFVGHHGCSSPGKKPPSAMGSYLFALRDHSVPGVGTITEANRHHFQNAIVQKRNHFLHEAGTTPATDHEINILLSDIHTCISLVASL